MPGPVPVGIYIQEARSLLHWSLADKEQLTAMGMLPGLLEAFPYASKH
ncbi:MAG: hypothetical protein GY765_43860 [bacterium]|nr:hypothetical protein [bacterium]